MLYDIQKKIILFYYILLTPFYAQLSKLDTAYFTDKDTLMQRVFRNAETYRLQIYLSYPTKNGWKHEFFGDTNRYFYPASLVKFPTVLACCHWLEKNNIPFKEWDSLYIFRKEKQNAKTLSDIKPCSIKEHIYKALVISDNESFNLLYELCGQEELKKVFAYYGMTNSRVVHHFGHYEKKSDTLYFNPVFLKYGKQKLIEISRKHSVRDLNEIPGAVMGNDYTKLCKQKNFSRSNHMPLVEAHGMLFDFLENKKSYTDNPEVYDFIKRCLYTYPENVYTGYDSIKHYKLLKKYLYYGSDKNGKPNEQIRILNIVGQSYGFLADVACFEFKNDRKKFYVSAVIYTNAKDCFGKGWYEYEQTGFPFLKTLGKRITEYVKSN
jgi:serine/threonine protein kinase